MRHSGPRICFVGSDENQPARRWFLYPSHVLPNSISCDINAAQAGEEPDADIYVVQICWRMPPAARWQALGKRVFYWLDDAIWMVPIPTEASSYWERLWPFWLEILKTSDGIITPSVELSGRLADEFGLNTMTVKNYHDYPPFSHSEEWTYEKLMTGYGGSAYHWTSWRDTELADKLLEVKDDVECHIIGNAIVSQMLRDRGLDVMSWPVQDWRGYLGMIARWDMGLIPVSGPYDMCRSWIKALEYALCGTPWIAYGAGSLIYSDVEGGVCVAQGEELKDYLHRARPEERRYMQGWAESQHVRYHVNEWLAAFESLVRSGTEKRNHRRVG